MYGYRFLLSLFYPVVSIIWVVRNALQGIGYSRSVMIGCCVTVL